MKQLSQLTRNIREWNHMGYSSLPSLQIAIIHSNIYNQIILKFLQTICPKDSIKHLIYKVKSDHPQSQSEKLNQQNNKKGLEIWDKQIQNTSYVIYAVQSPIQCKIHLLNDQEKDGQITDESLKNTKKTIQKLKRNKNIIFINCNSTLFKLDVNSEHIQLFGLGFKSKQKQIKIQNFLNQKSQFDNPVENLLNIIHKKYISVYAANINKSYNQMKLIYKIFGGSLKKYQQIIKLRQKFSISQNYQNKDKQLISYSLKCLNESKQYLISDLMGTFSNIHRKQDKITIPNNFKIKMNGILSNKKHKLFKQNGRSTHWQIMQMMNQFWEIQMDVLMKQIQKMPLAYIEQKYKMLDYQSIGGFMPSSCFQAIFSPPLRKTVNQIIYTLKAIEMKILKNVQNTFQYFFDNLNIVYDFSDQQHQSVQKICQRFIKDTQRTLNSQIQYINTSPDDFWSYKQLKSSLYGPQQQIYIQIKYIGKTYIKKVFENIKQTVPRLIGQNLLKQICFYLENNSLECLISMTREVPLQIFIDNKDLLILQSERKILNKIDRLVYFFSLRTDTTASIKNYHERIQNNWKRMYGNKIIVQEKQQVQKQEKKGFLAWARNLFKSKPKQQKRIRSQSQEKVNKNQQKQVQTKKQLKSLKKENVLSQKNWLLIINISKNVQRNKIQQSAKEGYPSRLRPAIWLYLSKKNQSIKFNKIQSLLEKPNTFSSSQKTQIEQIYRQIQKDVLRTPPASLFRSGYLKQSLTNVLRAYAIQDKDLRYTQGMNFIVGIVLCVLTYYGDSSDYLDESRRSKGFLEDIQNKALVILEYIMYQKGLRKIMFIQRQTITDLCIRLESYIQKVSPNMANKISRSGFSIEMIFSGALISGLTTSQVTLDLQKRVLDMLITFNFSILYKIIGQFIGAAENLCQKLQNQNLYYFLKGKFYNEVYKQIGDEGLNRMFKSL